MQEHLNSLVNDSQYMCLLVCTITQVADSMVSKASDAGLGTPKSDEEGIGIEGRKVKSATASIGVFKSAMSLYLHALGRMRTAMIQITAAKKSFSSDQICLDIISKLSEVIFLTNRYDSYPAPPLILLTGIVASPLPSYSTRDCRIASKNSSSVLKTAQNFSLLCSTVVSPKARWTVR